MTRTHRSRLTGGLAVLIAVIVVIGFATPAAALYDPNTSGDANGDVDPNPNPPFPQQCGPNVLLVLDSSASLSSQNLTDVKAAAKDTVDVLAGTDAVSSVGVVSFNQTFASEDDGADTRIGITELDSQTDVQSVKNAIEGIQSSDAETLTNWEAAFLESSLSENDEDGDVPDEDLNKPADLIIFVSDGNPNAYGYPGLNGTGLNDSKEAATLGANVVKDEGTRIIGIGIPDGDGTSPPPSSFEAITNGSSSVTGSADDQQNDFYLADSSSELSGIMTGIAEEFDCGLSVEKLNDANGDDTFTDNETADMPGQNVTYQVEVTNTGNIELSLDSYSDDKYGTPDLSSALVGETLAPGESMVVTFVGEAPPETETKENTFTVIGSDEDGDQISDLDTTVVQSPDLTPSISVEKLVDGDGDGTFSDSEIASTVGGDVTYKVIITNDGPNTVTIDDYLDDIYGTPSLNQSIVGDRLEPNESVTVTFEGTAPDDEEATKTNTFTVNVSDDDGDQASDNDTASVTAPDLTPSIAVEKLVDANGDGTFSDTETAPTRGEEVVYKVTVTNDGPNNVTVNSWDDSLYDSPNLNQSLVGTTLEPNESITVIFNGTAPEEELGSKTNTFTVNGSDDDGDQASDSDDATVNGPDLTPSITVEKLVDGDGDGEFSNLETASSVGGDVTYKVIVTNDGPNNVSIDSYSDSIYGSPSLNQSLVGETLEPNESITVTFEGSAPEDEEATKTNTFTVTASDGDGDEASDDDDATVQAPDLTPSIEVTKLNDANADETFSDDETSPMPGDTVRYLVVVTNDGPNNVTIQNISDDVYDSLDLNQSLAGETLEPGESIHVSFNGSTPEAEDTAKTNTVTVNATDDDGDVAMDQDDTTVRSPDLTPSITVEKLLDADGDGTFSDSEIAAEVGGDVTYKVIVTNDGPNNVTIDSWNDSVYDSPALNQSLQGEELEPGESITVIFNGTAPEDEEATKTNEFTVNASDDDGDETSDSDVATVEAPDLTPSIEVTKLNDANDDGTFSDDETSTMPGDDVTYLVIIKNDGPNNVTIQNVSDDVYDSLDLNRTVTGETLQPGEAIHVSFTGSTPEDEDTTKTNTFSVNATDDDGDVASDDDDTTVRSPDLTPSITVTKVNDANDDGTFTDDETTPMPGDDVTYLVVVTNDGPNNITIQGYSDDVYGSPTLNQSLTGETLEPGDSIHVSFQGSSPESEETAKENTFTVEAADDDGDVATAQDNTTVRSPDLTPAIEVNKTVDADGDGDFNDTEIASTVGGDVTYKIVVTNVGPNNVTIDSFNDSVYDAPSLNQTLVDEVLEPNESITITFNGTAPDSEEAEKTNTFTVNASDDDGDLATDNDQATVIAPDLTPSIDVVKAVDANGDGVFTDSEEADEPDATVTYQVTVTNDGPNNVTIDSYSDDVYGSPTLNQSLVDETLVPGESITVTFEGSAPSDYNASKTNTFTVEASDNDGDQALDSDTATVTTPPEERVCARTPGFWSTHNGDYARGNNLDLTTSLLPIWLGDAYGDQSVYVDSDDIVDDIFDAQLTADSKKSNGITKLYIHLLAAKLNVENGAVLPDEVEQAITRSDAILADHDESDWSDIRKNNRSLAQEIEDLKDTLDAYNNGQYDGENCTEDWWNDDGETSLENPWTTTVTPLTGLA